MDVNTLKEKKPAEMTVHEAHLFIENLRGLFDMAFLINVDDGMAWEIDEDDQFGPVDKCYRICQKEGRCPNCSARKCVEELCTIDKYDKIGEGVYHVINKPIVINSKVYALILKIEIENDEDFQRREALIYEQEKNLEIIRILASEYTSVYYIDLTTDGLTPYSMNEETEMTFGSVFRSGIHYSDAFRMYVNKLVFPEDKPMMLNSGSIGNIMKELKNKKTFLTTYRDSEGHYSEMKFVKVGNEDDFPEAVALGFANKDDELRAKEEEAKILQRNIDIIEILASEYSSVYYIDMTTDELDPYTMNVDTESKFGSIFRSGIKYSDAYRLYVDKLVYPADRQMMLRAGSVYNIFKELGNKKTFITRYRDNDGNYCEMKFVKVGEDDNPKAVALGFANRDSDIRGEMERKLADARDRAVISGLSDDYGCVSYVGYDGHEVHYRTDPFFDKSVPGWTTIDNFGVKLEMLINTIVHPEDRKEFYEATRKEVVFDNIRRVGVYLINFRILVNGEVTYYQAKFVRDVNSDDHVIIGFHNVDETIKRELDALDKAEVASRAKSTFLFNMSHDIRTPMNAIVGFTMMAKKHCDEPDKISEYLGKIEVAGNQLLALINQVLEMSRIESGKIILQNDSVSITDHVSIIKTIYGEQAEANGIHFECASKNIAHNRVMIDSGRVKQITTNIVGNALKYTSEGGTVKYTVSEIPYDREGYGLYVITVEDTGIGMSEEYVEHIFDEFSRENSSTVSQIQGTGLGMSIVKRLTDLMGGKIDIISEKGRGTCISVTIPALIDSDVLDEDEIGVNPEDVNLNDLKVLLVEDNEMNREIAEEILSESGVIVTVAEDGDIAVDIVRNSAPDDIDIILMDVQMPRMNGYEATKAIRSLEDKSLASIPIIAMTANAFEEDRRDAAEAGMDAHLSKPIEITKLIQTLSGFRR